MWWQKIKVKRTYKCNYKIIKSQYIICPHCQEFISHKHLISHIRTFHKIPKDNISQELITQIEEIKRTASSDVLTDDVDIEQLKKEFEIGTKEGWLFIGEEERVSRKKKPKQ